MALAVAGCAEAKVCVSLGLASCDSHWALAQPREVTQGIGLTSPSRAVAQGWCPLLLYGNPKRSQRWLGPEESSNLDGDPDASHAF